MRINKYIAQAGIASRRGADELITKGKVKVNGAVLTEPGYDVKDGDHITVNGEPITASEQKVYYIMNKPTGFITSVRDERGRRTVLDLMPDVEARIFPVGRLDYNTSGLLFLTNDGDLAYGLTHPKHEVGKTYRVLCEGVSKGGLIEGRTEGNIIIEFPAGESVIGTYQNVEVTESLTWILRGRAVDK